MSTGVLVLKILVVMQLEWVLVPGHVCPCCIPCTGLAERRWSWPRVLLEAAWWGCWPQWCCVWGWLPYGPCRRLEHGRVSCHTNGDCRAWHIAVGNKKQCTQRVWCPCIGCWAPVPFCCCAVRSWGGAEWGRTGWIQEREWLSPSWAP